MLKQHKLKRFHEFFSRATREELNILIGPDYKISPTTSHQKARKLSEVKGIKDADPRLLACVTSLIEAVHLEDKDYTSIWANTDPRHGLTFREADARRSRVLLKGIAAYEARAGVACCALRLIRIIFHHYVCQVEERVQPSQLGPWVDRSAVAYEEIARQYEEHFDGLDRPEQLKILKKIRENRRAGKQYLLIAVKCKPGILLEMGSQTSW